MAHAMPPEIARGAIEWFLNWGTANRFWAGRLPLRLRL
jgi:hypothetical protein